MALLNFKLYHKILDTSATSVFIFHAFEYIKYKMKFVLRTTAVERKLVM